MSDLISRQKVIEAIVNSPSRVQDENMPLTDKYDGATFRQIEILGIIDTLPSAQEWIPVSERLPEKGGWYLVTWEDQFKTVRRVAVSEFIEPKGLTDIRHFEGFVMNEVIAWMPLPESYRGGDAE